MAMMSVQLPKQNGELPLILMFKKALMNKNVGLKKKLCQQ